MKLLVQLGLSAFGLNTRADAVAKETGINPFDYNLLSFGVVARWLGNSYMWLSLLEDKDFIERIHILKKENSAYRPEIFSFMPIFFNGPIPTLNFLKKLDEASAKATGHLFPDDLLMTAVIPNGGPIFDLFTILEKEKRKVPYKLIDPWILTLGLQFSQVPKDINNLRTITKRDINFLAQFIIQIATDNTLTQKLTSYLDNEDVFTLFVIAIRPEKPLRALDYDEQLIKERLIEVSNTITMYEEKPEILKTIYEE